jgi:hypothetical protein
LSIKVLSGGINSPFAGWAAAEEMFIGAIETTKENKGVKLFQFSPFLIFSLPSTPADKLAVGRH